MIARSSNNNINMLFVCTTPYYYPIEIIESNMLLDSGQNIEFPIFHPYQGNWGEIVSQQSFLQEGTNQPVAHIDITYLSLVEHKVYSINENLKDIIQKNVNNDLLKEKYDSFIIGMAPYGGIAIWLNAEEKGKLLFWGRASQKEFSENACLPNYNGLSVSYVCDFYVNADEKVKNNLKHNGLPPRDLFDNYMKQFTYRYQVILEHWDEDEEKWIKYDEEKDKVVPEFEYIEETLFDGTHDKLHDGGLMKYHEAGKPKKLALKWHIKRSDYSAYFWFEEEEICAIFNKFYGQHPDTKTDFIIHIDPIKKKYELSLYRYGLKEPVIIPESAYQLIVFKSRFENYRSDNYNQPTGAWIW